MFTRKSKNEITLPTELEMVEKVGDNSIEKGMPEPDVVQSKQSNMKKMGLFLGLLLATGLIVMGLMSFSGGEETVQASKPVQEEIVSTTQSHDFQQDKNEIENQAELEMMAASDMQTASDVPPPIATTESAPQSTPQPEPTAETPPQSPEKTTTLRERRLMGNVLVNTNNTNGNSEEYSGSLTKQPESTASFFSDGETKQNPLAAQLQATATPSASAQNRGNMDYVLAKGTNILCTLETQIITTRAGFTRCVITRDIYSANGKVLLLEKGSRIIGEQTAALLQGQARVGILWNEVTTPKGITVSLASPAAGQLGAAGVGARVQYHFWQRFGGAIMISLIGDLGDSYSNRQKSNNGQNITFENSSEAAQDMATEALKNSINIPPTAYINHGTLINIMVARDVDFSGVYEVVRPYEMF